MAGCLAGCQEDGSAPGGPTVICGTTLSKGAEGADVRALTRSPGPGIRQGSVDSDVYLRLARGCAHGVDVRITPTGSYRIVKAARARDGKLVAIALKAGTRGRGLLTATRGGRIVGYRVLRFG
jgi:hypothetical protein